MQFKVGDKVKILDGSYAKDYTGGWVDSMDIFVGTVGTIEIILDEKCVKLKHIVWVFDPRYFELITKTNAKNQEAQNV